MLFALLLSGIHWRLDLLQLDAFILLSGGNTRRCAAISYADDMTLLSSSLSALPPILGVASDFPWMLVLVIKPAFCKALMVA